MMWYSQPDTNHFAKYASNTHNTFRASSVLTGNKLMRWLRMTLIMLLGIALTLKIFVYILADHWYDLGGFRAHIPKY